MKTTQRIENKRIKKFIMKGLDILIKTFKFPHIIKKIKKKKRDPCHMKGKGMVLKY